MAKRSRYGEDTVLVSLRVPESKKDEILDRFYVILSEYNVSYASQIKVVDAVIESVAVEKKSNPADVVVKEVAEKPQATFEFIHPPKKPLKVEKDYVVSVIDIDAEKKAKIAMLKEIASGNGPKKVGSFISEKTPLEERYEFDENTTLPDIEYRVAIGSKGIAFTDMYDASFIYLKHGHRYFRFSDRKEFDRFVKTEGILL